jgi:hypothetical protein
MGVLATDDLSYLEVALRETHLAFTMKHQLSKKIHEESCKYLPGGNTRTVLHASPFPLTIASGKSCMLNTVDGHEYIDLLGEVSTLPGEDSVADGGACSTLQAYMDTIILSSDRP